MKDNRRFRSALYTAIAIACSIFSWWLMNHTFSYDPLRQEMILSAKVWSDFGAHIPLIRSFSKGDNWPPVHPGFPGEAIRYHYGFYFVVGMIEKAGLRIDYALNIPSVLGMTLLLTSLAAMGPILFGSVWVGVLSVVFLLFNGSLGIIEYFKRQPLSLETIRSLPEAIHFTAFGPWDGGEVTAFWILNIFTNQRHLAPAMGIALAAFLLLLILKGTRRKPRIAYGSLVIIVSMGALLFINQAIALCFGVIISWLFITSKRLRLPIVGSALILVPWYFYLKGLSGPIPEGSFSLGYLARQPLTLWSFVHFWIWNLGLHTIFIPLGIALSPKRIRVILAPPAIFLFAVANIWQFSPDMINNHKLFNFMYVLAVPFSAYAIVRMADAILAIRSHVVRAVSFVPLLFLVLMLTASGIADLFPVLNRQETRLADANTRPAIAYYLTTPPESIVLNDTWFYHPANLAGRKIFSGYPYFTWSYGYDKDAREREAQLIYGSPDALTACRLLGRHNIRYVELSDKPEYVKPNMVFWDSLLPSFEDDGIRIYDMETVCGPIF